jgi:PIN domain nuclease of toxin-antitoxin system
LGGGSPSHVNVLIDTHALIWWMEGAERLSNRAAEVISASKNNILISASVAWELAIKVANGKVQPASIIHDVQRLSDSGSFSELTITLHMAVRAGSLPPHHRDPFDRMLVAQSQLLHVPILSRDAILDLYEVERIW